VEELERALLRLEARLDEVLERLLARRRRLAAYNATALIKEEILAGQTAARMVRCTVIYLDTAANAGTARHGRRIRGILTSCVHRGRILRVL